MIRCARAGIAALLVASAAVCGCGPAEAPLQSAERPYDIEPLGPVRAARSDRRSRAFFRRDLPGLISVAANRFTRENIERNFPELELDPARLEIAEATRVRVYFVGESSGYYNALGVNTGGVGIEDGRPALIFPNASTVVNLYASAEQLDPERGLDPEALPERTPDEPLHPGDFVDLGKVRAGTRLNFFIIPTRSPDNLPVYTTVPERNPDGVAHAVAVAVEDSPYLLISFEDMMGGGDSDYSDCVFAVEMSRYNVQALLGRIDPWRRAKQLAAAGFVAGVVAGAPALVWFLRRRRRRRAVAMAEERARRLLEAAHPGEALDVLDAVAREVPDGEDRERLWPLELAAGEQLGDMARLQALHDESRVDFAEHEGASLLAARAQLESGRFDRLDALRDTWRERETRPAAWLALDADRLLRSERPEEARRLLETRAFPGPEDSGRLARLAFLAARAAPDRARTLAEEAVARAPDNPDARLFAGWTFETLGGADEAAAAFETALRLSSGNPFFREQLGEHHRRAGRYRRALETWREGLGRPSTDTLWLRVLFWGRVASRDSTDWTGLVPPPGPHRALVDYLMRLKPGRFWDDAAFEAAAERHPELLALQEVFWLRLLQALKDGHEDEALTRLNLERFGHRSWSPPLEWELPRILTHRRIGFMEPAPSDTCRPRCDHPLFAAMDRCARGADDADEPIGRLLGSDEVYAAACFGVGWREAGLALLRAPQFQGAWPEWFLRDILAALVDRGDMEKAGAFARAHGLAPAE